MNSTDNRNLMLFENLVKSVPNNWKCWIAPAYLSSKTVQPEVC